MINDHIISICIYTFVRKASFTKFTVSSKWWNITDVYRKLLYQVGPSITQRILNPEIYIYGLAEFVSKYRFSLVYSWMAKDFIRKDSILTKLAICMKGNSKTWIEIRRMEVYWTIKKKSRHTKFALPKRGNMRKGSASASNEVEINSSYYERPVEYYSIRPVGKCIHSLVVFAC